MGTAATIASNSLGEGMKKSLLYTPPIMLFILNFMKIYVDTMTLTLLLIIYVIGITVNIIVGD